MIFGPRLRRGIDHATDSLRFAALARPSGEDGHEIGCTERNQTTSTNKMRLQHKCIKKSPGFCPVACQIISPFIFSNCFRNFCNQSQLNSELFSKLLQSKPTQFRIVFETFAIEANSSSHFRAIFRFRIAINSKLDTNSNHNSTSSWNRTWIRARAIVSVREVRARGGGLY